MRRIAPAVVLLLALSPMAGAQSLIAAYSAWIGPEDLVNSTGQRLTEPWQVLRQDRANYHRFGIRHAADQGDPVFASAEARAQMESLIRAGRIDPAARRAILQGGTMVQVQVYGWGDRLHSVQVQTGK